MSRDPITGHDGPYPAPVEVQKRQVEQGWIDYNGHMNVGYYGIAFDQASDVLLSDYLGIGEEHAAASGQGPYILQSHQHYLREMLEGETFAVRFRLLDHDRKRLHFFAEMVSDRTGDITATQESILMNVDHGTGRSAEYPDWAVQRFARMKADHAGLEPSPQIGAPLGLRR
ncbi:thioesterase family protein [Phaeobacter marinintestinus]|uniref:thioesterase family protein n=1 Tax=Falsiphaeobacter marinintestinus TaxID=1492905 RepID=UPI0011B65423|nr:thioesterase family protein [Phaeobacter marinintestinus]